MMISAKIDWELEIETKDNEALRDVSSNNSRKIPCV